MSKKRGQEGTSEESSPMAKPRPMKSAIAKPKHMKLLSHSLLSERNDSLQKLSDFSNRRNAHEEQGGVSSSVEELTRDTSPNPAEQSQVRQQEDTQHAEWSNSRSIWELMRGVERQEPCQREVKKRLPVKVHRWRNRNQWFQRRRDPSTCEENPPQDLGYPVNRENVDEGQGSQTSARKLVRTTQSPEVECSRVRRQENTQKSNSWKQGDQRNPRTQQVQGDLYGQRLQEQSFKT